MSEHILDTKLYLKIFGLLIGLTAVTVIVNVCGSLVSTPPLAVPPSSWIRTVTVTVPLALAA